MTDLPWCAWTTPEHGLQLEELDVLARRIARAGDWSGWVWVPGSDAWRAWWAVPELVAVVAAEMPPVAPVEVAPKPVADPSVARKACAARPARDRSPERVREIRKAPPDMDTFFMLAAQRQGGRAVARFEKETRRATDDWEDVSLLKVLKVFGYTVDKDVGLDAGQRREILADFLYCELPRQWEGRHEWFEPATGSRLRKMTGFILNHNVRNFRKQNFSGSYDTAIQKWEDDAEWLQSTFGPRL